MLRGGYMKYVANGIFSSYMPLRRITRKIEQIIREEMDAIDGQEVQFPVVLPASLWEESGRYGHVGRELLRFSDRNKSPMVLGMTHEEAAVQLVREYGQSYSRYPFMIYQIQTKFRDEARPRGGLIRVPGIYHEGLPIPFTPHSRISINIMRVASRLMSVYLHVQEFPKFSRSPRTPA